MGVFGELAVVLTVSTVLAWPESTLSPGEPLAVWAAFMALFFVVTATWGHGRVTITHQEVRVRTCRGEARTRGTPWRRSCTSRGSCSPGGWTATSSCSTPGGTPLWQSLTKRWSHETVRALLSTGQEMVTVPAAAPAQLEERWPRVLPRRYVEHVRSCWTTVGATLGAIALIIGVTALVMM